jgi:hypothetical protein
MMSGMPDDDVMCDAMIVTFGPDGALVDDGVLIGWCPECQVPVRGAAGHPMCASLLPVSR